jgi:hypothetical protein
MRLFAYDRQKASFPRAVRNQAAFAATLVAAALILPACGSSSGSATTATDGGAGASNGSNASGASRLDQFSQCMRSHGEPQFPDPTAQGKFPLGAGLATNSPQFQAAQQACKAVAPPGPVTGQAVNPTQLSRALKFVSCMRSHGVSSFPDPTAQGKFLASGTLPVNSPQFFSAYKICRALLPPGSGFGAGG